MLGMEREAQKKNVLRRGRVSERLVIEVECCYERGASQTYLEEKG